MHIRVIAATEKKRGGGILFKLMTEMFIFDRINYAETRATYNIYTVK